MFLVRYWIFHCYLSPFYFYPVHPVILSTVFRAQKPRLYNGTNMHVLNEKELEPRLKEGEEGKRQILFVDASHFVFGALIGYLWAKVRRFVKEAHGRKRFNVLGAINPFTLTLLYEVNDSYVNAETVCQLLRQIKKRGFKWPVTLVMDNARYRCCHLVQNLAETLGIELLFLPSHSPNLNLIERYWNRCSLRNFSLTFSKKRSYVLFSLHFCSH